VLKPLAIALSVQPLTVTQILTAGSLFRGDQKA
jgi:hypothetical protein